MAPVREAHIGVPRGEILGSAYYKKKRRSMSGLTHLSGRRPGRVSLFGFMFISVALLTLSRINHGLIEEFRSHISEIATPAFELVSKPVIGFRRMMHNGRSLLTGVDELDRLKLENQKLQQWKWRAKQLERKLDAYAKIVQAVERPSLGFVTGRVVSEGRGPFARSVLINTGRKDGVRRGYPVVSADGLVGRVVNSGRSASHILLLTDLNSRIPVEIGGNRTRAILRGDNGSSPRLTYISKDAQIKIGAEVFTSGQGGLLPRGLRIGKVAIEGKFYRVALYAQIDQLEYLSVLFFKTPGIDIADIEAASGRPKRLGQPVSSIRPGAHSKNGPAQAGSGRNSAPLAGPGGRGR